MSFKGSSSVQRWKHTKTLRAVSAGESAAEVCYGLSILVFQTGTLTLALSKP